MSTLIHPYWAAEPPEHRLIKKPYKSLDHPTAFVPEHSLLFKVWSYSLQLLTDRLCLCIPPEVCNQCALGLALAFVVQLFGLGHTWPHDLAMLMSTPCLLAQAMRLKHGLRFRAMAVGLRLAGQEKIASMIISSWKVGTRDQCIIGPWQRSHPQWDALCVCASPVC